MLENTHTKMELYQEQPQKYALSTEASTSSTTFLTAQKRASLVIEAHLGPVFLMHSSAMYSPSQQVLNV